ncbi:MAG: hypothetical protein OMM_14876, partial [Candidatus Magnetoglobus multicellularis str. Araruama]
MAPLWRAGKTAQKNEHLLIQTSSNKRPIYRKTLLNGLPTVSFDGVNDCLLADYNHSPPLNELSLITIGLAQTDKPKDESQIIFSLGEHLRRGIHMGYLDSESNYQPVVISYHHFIDRYLMNSTNPTDTDIISMTAIFNATQTQLIIN